MQRTVSVTTSPDTDEIFRITQPIPLKPDNAADKEREQTMLADWRRELGQLLSDGWELTRTNTMENLIGGTYRIQNNLKRTRKQSE